MGPVELAAEVEEVIRQTVLVLIDHALDCNDKATFLLLTRELKNLDAKLTTGTSPEHFTK